MATYSQLKRRQLTLKGQVSALLDEFLIGSVSTKGPKRPGFNLTYNVDQITKSRHVRKDLEKRVIRMWRLLAFRPENENWWRRGESNSRPRWRHSSVYVRVLPIKSH